MLTKPRLSRAAANAASNAAANARRNYRAWAYVLVILATLFWAGNVTLGRALRYQAGPFTISAARMVVASLVFVPLLRGLPAPERPLRNGRSREWPWLLAMALLGMVGCPVTLYLALRSITAGSTSLINGTGPLMTAVLAAWLLRTRLKGNELAGAVLSLFGVLLVIGGGESRALSGFTLNQGGVIMLANVARAAIPAAPGGAGMAPGAAHDRRGFRTGDAVHRGVCDVPGVPGLERRGAPPGTGRRDGVL